MITQNETRQELHIVELVDDEGTYCLVYTDDMPAGQEATYDSLEQAARAVVLGERKRGENYALIVHGDDSEFARFNTELARARREHDDIARLYGWNRQRRSPVTGHFVGGNRGGY